MKKRITALLTVVIALILLTNASFSSASGITSASIKDKQNQILKAEEERKNLQSSLSDAKAIKKRLEADKQDLSAYVMELDKQLQEIQDNIARLNEQIDTKEKEIEEAKIQLAEAQEREEIQYDNMVQQIQFMYEEGESTYLDAILSGRSISEILNTVEYVEQISVYDKQQLDEYILNRELIEVTKLQLETDMKLLEEAKAGVLSEEEAMEYLILAKKEAIEEKASNIATKEMAIKEYEADIKEQDEIVQALEAAIAEEKRKLLAANGTVLSYDGGIFKFPVASYTRISSDYGMRLHPILGVDKFHNGVDLASSTGTAIYAAYDGKVVAASYSGSMGNYVMIDHGSNLYTIYMHASALYVSSGDIVIKGETIAAVGSTGRSTAPHLHFSVRLNGEYTSPWNYLSP